MHDHGAPHTSAPRRRRGPTRGAWLLPLWSAACTIGWQDPEAQPLADYRQSYFDAVGTRVVATLDRDAVLADIERAGVVWLGDHHRHSLLHGLHLELISELRARGRKLAFGLEAVGTQDEGALQEYLDGAIDLRQLRRRIGRRWSGSWLDDRQLDPGYFRSLLTTAKAAASPVFALEPTPRLSLPERDRRIAAAVAAARERWPDHLLVVVVGQAHLLGEGSVVAGSGVGGVVVGGAPPPTLAAPTPAPQRGALVRSDGGVLWFGEMFER